MCWMLTLVMMSLPVLASAQEAPVLKTERDKLSYAMGMDLGQQLKTQSVDIDPALFGRGLADALAGGKTLLTTEEAKAAISQLQMAMIVKRAEEARLAGEKNRKEGRLRSLHALQEAIVQGAAKRLRPKFMTVATTFIGFFPIMLATGTGSDVWKRIAAPMIGGIFTSFLLELVVYPAIYEIWKWHFEVKPGLAAAPAAEELTPV